ncbi:MAG: GNAT family N-acetyltransferase [Gaiellaceae bacterium]
MLAIREGGTALIEAAVDWALGAGVEQLDLEVLADNEPALALYRNTGFVETGRRGRAVRMSRAL